MNWPQLRTGSDRDESLVKRLSDRDESLVKRLDTDNFQDILTKEQIFYDKDSCGSEIEFDSIGEPVDGQTVDALVRDLRAIKEKLGPNNQENKRQFDLLASERLHEANILDHQGWNKGVWRFLQLSLFDVVHWRWAKTLNNGTAGMSPGDKKNNISYQDRLFSQPVNRGCLSRLWLWNKILLDPQNKKDNRHLIKNLQEDNKVAIIERTTASSDGRLALAVARKHANQLNETAPRNLPHAQVLRRVMKLIIFKMAGIETLALDDTQLIAFVGNCFKDAQDSKKWKS
jgi:hypothetical protein